MLRDESPEEALSIVAERPLEEYLARDVSDLTAAQLGLACGSAANLMTVHAILGNRREANMLMRWIEEHAPAVMAGTHSWPHWWGLVTLCDVVWLKMGTVDPAIVRRCAEAYPADGEDDVEIRLLQVLLLLEANDIVGAKSLLDQLSSPGSPVLAHSRRILTPRAAAQIALQSIETPPPAEFERPFVQLLGRLRRQQFTKGLFTPVLPWLRLYNRLYLGESDPWKLIVALQDDPTRTLSLAK